MEERKKDHIELAFLSQISRQEIDRRFNYEPMLRAHSGTDWPPFVFLGKTFRIPLWVSSMTGGTKMAHTINHNLARACREFGMGMGLGSCRILMDDDRYLPDFDVRKLIGDEQPLFANLGIAQMEAFHIIHNYDPVVRLVEKIKADGLIIHVNPIQESLQPEGDRLSIPPIEVIADAVDKLPFPIIVKEVGQGMGPGSLRQLLSLPLAAIDFAAFGGTNFARLELMRGSEAEKELYGPLALIGHDAFQMAGMVNSILEEMPDPACKQVIISGGIKSFLDGYYLMEKTKLPAIYGQASSFLKYARGEYQELQQYVRLQVKGLVLAKDFLTIVK